MSAGNRDARSNATGDHAGDVGGIIADAIDEPGLGIVKPGEADKEQPRILSRHVAG